LAAVATGDAHRPGDVDFWIQPQGLQVGTDQETHQVQCGVGLNPERFLHLLTNSRQTLDSTAADFRGCPTAPLDIIEPHTDLIPWHIVLGRGDIDEFVLGSTKAFNVELDGPVPERVEPLAGLAVLPVIADIVIHTDPRALETVDKLDEPSRLLFRRCVVIVMEFIPNVFDQNRLTERCR